MTTIELRLAGSTETLVAPIRRLLIAGFTGRDQQSVKAHVDELAELGVPVPERLPILMHLPAGLVTVAGAICVGGSFTSGEVEGVVVVHGGERYLTVGSDHTDRELERQDIALSKAACPKVLGTTAVRLADIPALDAVSLESKLEDEVEAYQQGSMADLLALDAIEELLAREGYVLTDGDVLFLGSIAVTGGKLRPAGRFSAALGVPGVGESLTLQYTIEVVPGTSALAQKPELEFTPVGDVVWAPCVPHVPGLSERILARHGDSAIATRMLRFAPGTDTSVAGTLTHDFWEEVYVLEGSLHDLRLGETFPAGTYACRPPGMPHGPWVAPEGCVTFEVRYPAPPAF